MSVSTDTSSQAKQEFYARSEIASTYHEQRFGGPSGAWVNEREVKIVLSLLPPFRRALDLGCGTGRLTRVLAQRGYTVGADTSAAMLAEAQREHCSSLVQGDAFRIPVAGASFDAVIALRLVFHLAQPEPLLREVSRILSPRGTFVFDTYLWTPRAWLPLDSAHWGGGVFAHPPLEIQAAAGRCGLQVVARESCFLFSPYLYRRLPFAVVRLLAQVEARMPPRLRARVFWAFERTR